MCQTKRITLLYSEWQRAFGVKLINVREIKSKKVNLNYIWVLIVRIAVDIRMLNIQFKSLAAQI